MTSAATGIGHMITIAWDTKAAWEHKDNQRVLDKGSFQDFSQGQREVREL